MRMTQEILHSKVANIEQETHVINNRQIVMYVVAIAMGLGTAIGWYFTNKNSQEQQKQETLQGFNAIKALIRENHLKDSINFIQLNDKIDNKDNLSDQRLKALEKTHAVIRTGYVNEVYTHGRNKPPDLIAAK